MQLEDNQDKSTEIKNSRNLPTTNKVYATTGYPNQKTKQFYDVQLQQFVQKQSTCTEDSLGSQPREPNKLPDVHTKSSSHLIPMAQSTEKGTAQFVS